MGYVNILEMNCVCFCFEVFKLLPDDVFAEEGRGRYVTGQNRVGLR